MSMTNQTEPEHHEHHVSKRFFEAFCPLTKAEGGTGPGDAPMVVSGPIASETKDYDGDEIVRAGVVKGLQTFVGLGGHVDYNHLFAVSQDPDHIIGKGEVFYVDSRPWLKTTLRKGNPWAEKAFRMVQDGLHCGYSLLGNGTRDGKKVVSTDIKMITIAPQPKGFDQFLQVGTPAGSLHAIAKALMADTPASVPGLSAWLSGVVSPGVSPLDYLDPHIAKALTTGDGVVVPGDAGGRALRPQYVGGGLAAVSESDAEQIARGDFSAKARRRAKARREQENLRQICPRANRDDEHDEHEFRGDFRKALCESGGLSEATATRIARLF